MPVIYLDSAQAIKSFNPATGRFSIPKKDSMPWVKTIDNSWAEKELKEKEKLKSKIEQENLPTSKAEIMKDYHWSTNYNMYVSNKTGKPSREVTQLYNTLVMQEHELQKNPQLEFFKEMLRTGKHPVTGEDITEAERLNAKVMMYSIALQPFVGAWAMSKVPTNSGSIVKSKRPKAKIKRNFKPPKGLKGKLKIKVKPKPKVEGKPKSEKSSGAGGLGSGHIGDFSDLQGTSVDDILSRIPKDANKRVLTPQPGKVTEGFEYTWKASDGTKMTVRVHGPDASAPVGSNVANGWIVRVKKGKNI